MVAGWVRDAMPSGDSGSAGWCRQALGGLLLELEAEELDDEDFLRICRETGRLFDLVNRLLALGRVDEALVEAQQAGDYDLLGLASYFVERGLGDRIEQMIAERARTSDDARLKEWLRKQATARGDFAAALTLEQTIFWQRPTLDAYQELRQLAQKLDRWPALRQEVIAGLTEKQQTDLLTRIYLDEGDIDRALETVQQPARSARYLRYDLGHYLKLEVAKAAEASRPQAAIDIYKQHVDAQIAARSRSNYAVAAEYLQHMRPLYQQLGREDEWRQLVTDTREQNPRLRALHDEMKKAGL
jgi:uncharacterized Zn finger protein